MANTITRTETIPSSSLHVARGYEAARSDPDDGDSLRPWMARVLVSMTLLTILATALRIWSRRLNHQSLWWDDWLAMFNLCWMFGVVAATSAAVGLGVGLHVRDIPLENGVPLIKAVLVVDFFYIWALVWSKLSLLLLYYRTFRFGYIKSAGITVGALILGWAVASTVLLFLICVPLNRLWDPHVVGGHCADSTKFRLVNSVITIVTDIVIMCLPMPLIWSLHSLKRMEKVSLSAIFCLGIFVVSISSIRIAFIYHDETRDKTYTIAIDGGWTIIEVSAGLVCASFPAMGPGLIQIWRDVRHWLDTCRGRAARGQAARPRQDMELSIVGSSAGLAGAQSPQQHPDQADGSFHRLYSKGQNGSAVTHVDEREQALLVREAQDPEMGPGSLRVAVDSDGASEEVSLETMLLATSVAKPDKH